MTSDETKSSSDLSNQALHGAKWAFIERWAARLLSLVTFMILSRLLGPDQFGVLAMAVVVITFLYAFVDAGVFDSVVQAKEVPKRFLDTAFWLSVIVGALFTVGAFFAAGGVATLYDVPQLEPVIQVLSVCLVLQALSAVQEALMQRTFQFRLIALRRTASSIAGGVVGVTWAIVSPSVWALVAQFFVGALVTTVMLWRLGSYRPSFSFDTTLVPRFLRYGLSVMGIRAMTVAGEQGDNLVIGLRLNPTALGYYTTGYRIYTIVTELVVGTMSSVAFPAFSRIQDDKERIVSAILKAIRLSFTLAVPFFAATAVLAPIIVPFVFGEQWRPSVPVMQILAVVGLLNAVIFLDQSVFLGMGRVRLEMALTAAATVANIAAFIIGSFWGIEGVAIALAIRIYAFWPIRLIALRHITGLKIRDYLSQLAAPALCGAVMVAAMLAVGVASPGWADLPAQALVGVVVYVGLLWLVGRDHILSIVSIAQRLRTR